MDVFVDSETAPLKSVIVGYRDNFLQAKPEVINETQRRFPDGPEAPAVKSMTGGDFGCCRLLLHRAQ